jgi:ankyrin repeat protein
MIPDIIKLFKFITEHSWEDFYNYLNKSKDIDVNIRDKFNNYLINYAVISNKSKIVKLLIEKGARIDIIDNDGHSLLFVPIKFNFLDILDILIESNNNTIGISLLNIKDKQGNTPLHYAGKVNNVEAVQTLLKYKANVNQVNYSEYNSLHSAISSRSTDIVKLILDNQIYINAKTDTGETALHIACNFKLEEVVDMLIKKNIDVNIADNDNQFTALNYAIKLQNIPIITNLISNGADVNFQDYFGDTVLHQCIKEQNYVIIDLLITSIHTSNKINYNLYNMDSELPIHIFFYRLDTFEENKRSLVENFITNSNLNFQNKQGVTPLHLICQQDSWKSFKLQLSKKKMNIFIKDNKDNRPIDYVNKEDVKDFINIVSDSYLYRLRNTNFIWKEDWENICKKDTKTFTKEDQQQIAKYKKNGNGDDDTCKNIIKNKITSIYKNNSDNCTYSSYPSKQFKKCITIDTGDKIEFCTFVGNTIDILFGLINLLNQHPDTCSTLDKDFIHSKEVCDHYRSLGVKIDDTLCNYLNFEVLWTYNHIFFASNFNKNINKCLKNKNKRFIIVPLGIEIDIGSHANYIIYDKKTNEVERFEPYGRGVPSEYDYKPNLLDKILENRFLSIDPDVKYIAPKQFMPKISFQHFDFLERWSKKIGDPGGFCALWAMWYIKQRLTYPDTDRTYLIGELLKNIRLKNISFKTLIRNYSENVIKIRDNILNKAGITINDWINEQYNENQRFKIMSEIMKSI